METTTEEPLRDAYKISEVAQRLGVSEDLIYKLIRRGEIGSIKAGWRRLITRRQLDAFLGQDDDRY